MGDFDPRSVPVRFSNLKLMGLSPAHYLSRISEPFADKAPMRRGRLVHALVLGGADAFVVYPAERRGTAWKEFQAENSGKEIVTAAEYETARRATDAVMSNPLAVELLQGPREVPLKWQIGGRACETRGVDVVGPLWVTELKTSTTAAPWRFPGMALRLGYHAQLAWYRDALEQHGHRIDGGFIVVVEMAPPFAVTTFELTSRALEQGQKLARLWFEQLLSCEASGQWPGYAQTTLPLDVPDDEPELIFHDGEAA